MLAIHPKDETSHVSAGQMALSPHSPSLSLRDAESRQRAERWVGLGTHRKFSERIVRCCVPLFLSMHHYNPHSTQYSRFVKLIADLSRAALS